MKILDSFIVKRFGKLQLLVYCGDGEYCITDSGAFGQRSMHIEKIDEEEALKLINEHRTEIPNDLK